MKFQRIFAVSVCLSQRVINSFTEAGRPFFMNCSGELSLWEALKSTISWMMPSETQVDKISSHTNSNFCSVHSMNCTGYFKDSAFCIFRTWDVQTSAKWLYGLSATIEINVAMLQHVKGSPYLTSQCILQVSMHSLNRINKNLSISFFVYSIRHNSTCFFIGKWE